MKCSGLLIIFFVIQAIFVSTAGAGDYGWMDSLNITARADSSGFRTSLSSRFHVGDADVKIVIGDVSKPSDAYMIFRLSELSHRPVAEVMTVYRVNRKKGWGVMARNLGIKPGSREFHALKRGHDLGIGGRRGQSSGKSKGKGHGKNKGMK